MHIVIVSGASALIAGVLVSAAPVTQPVIQTSASRLYEPATAGVNLAMVATPGNESAIQGHQCGHRC
jgi:hypothetical protein